MIGEFVAGFLGMEVRPCSQLFDDCYSRVPLKSLLEQRRVPLGILLVSSTVADVIPVAALSPGVAVNYRNLPPTPLPLGEREKEERREMKRDYE